MRTLHFAFLLLPLLLACGSDRSTVENLPPDTSISGMVLDSKGVPCSGATVIAHGTSFEDSVQTGSDGRFSFDRVPPGEYTLVPRGDAGQVFWPHQNEVRVPGSRVSDAVFIRSATFCLLCGVVLDEQGEPLSGVFIRYGESPTNARGFYSISGTRGTAFTLHPLKYPYAYTFSPDSVMVTLGDSTTVCNFTASYSGPSLHAVTVRLTTSTGQGINGGIISIHPKNEFAGSSGISDAAGYATVRGLMDGEYSVYPEAQQVIFESRTRTFTIAGKDLVIPDIIGENEVTRYHIRGRTIDAKGSPIPDIRVLDVRSSSSGTFQIEKSSASRRSTRPPEPVLISPKKDGYSFVPASATVALAFVDGTLDSIIVLPDFTATEYSLFAAADYFPLSASSSRTYSRTVNLLPATDNTITVSETLTQNGQTYRTLTPSGPAGFTAYRAEGNSVFTLLDNAAAELFRFGVVPGTIWQIGKAGGMYPLTGTFLGLETVSVPAGTFSDCLKYKVRKEYGATSHETYTLWFARGVGMVRSEIVLVNYGEEKERVVDELCDGYKKSSR